jgi:ABC-type Fe3+/spermidine/putrescine transport system ATPase subunit
MTVAENVGYGLKINKWPKDKIAARVRELLEMVELEAFGDRMIDKLSGGQQQRVAFARALSLEPKVLLLDEPLSNLDANLRLVMREEIRKLQERLHITTVFVTHDQFEAMAISDRLVVMKDGLIEQVGTPIEIYERPVNEFIAAFVGYVNFMDGRVESIDPATKNTVIHTEFGRLEIELQQSDVRTGDEVLMVIRPESVLLSIDCGGKKQNVLCGTLKTYMYAGSIAKCTVEIGAKKMIVDQYNPRDAQQFQNADRVEVEIPRSVHLLKKKI